MHRLGLLLLLLCAATGSARAADPPAQKFVVFFQEWSAAIDDSAQAVISQAAEWVKSHPGNVAHVNGFADPTGSKAGQHPAVRSARAGRGRSVADRRRRSEARAAARPWLGAVRADLAGEPAGGNQHRPALSRMLQSLVQAEAWDDPAAVLRRVFGFPGFRGQQEQVVRHVVARRRCAGAGADGRRQEHLLPGAGAVPARHRGGDLAADRADGRSGGGAAPARRGRRRAAFRTRSGRSAQRRRAT